MIVRIHDDHLINYSLVNGNFVIQQNPQLNQYTLPKNEINKNVLKSWIPPTLLVVDNSHFTWKLMSDQIR